MTDAAAAQPAATRPAATHPDAPGPLDVLVVGSVNLDTGFVLDRLPRDGETIESRDAQRSGGGKGANQALAAAQLGARTALLAAVGRDADEALADLVDAGVDLATLVRIPDALTGTAVLLVTPADNAIVIAPGANALLSADHVRALDEPAAAAPRVVALQHEVPAEVVAAAVERWAGRSLVVLNPSPWRAVAPELLARIDVLVVNRLELGELLGIPEPADRAAAERALADSAFGAPGGSSAGAPRHVIVTLGSGGVLLRTGGATAHLPAFEVDAVDTVGAGDAFLGALAAGLAAGASGSRGQDAASLDLAALTAAARRATAAAALAVTVRGARNPSLAAPVVDALLADA
ncbi:ribokinase [Schumannella luteola]|uniref:Ribokinase n=1 Tax=Schumannella luteola TaxID=472059 RepID=A0A852YGR9_9MICO|nr:PfkB family carbohydrate kinase [Schumannella luteola]NYG98218.1 ribokinase [Schumannella luteola]TPX02164.1 ribokinase [Schumannella luteola]